MITRLRAKVIAKGTDFLIADVNGIGLKVRVPAPLLDTVNSLGKEVNLFTHLRLAENGRESVEDRSFGKEKSEQKIRSSASNGFEDMRRRKVD